jgi:class 3 adenylate cyclase
MMMAVSRDHKMHAQAAQPSKNNKSVLAGRLKAPFANVVQGYERALFLGKFFEAGRIPSIAHVEIAVCFADLRGFTKYVDTLQSKGQDSRVQELLGEYFQIYPKAVLEVVYALEPTEPNEISAVDDQVRHAIVPSMYKTLGDGMMLVWELSGERSVQDAVAARILQVVATAQRLFRRLLEKQTRNAATPYSQAAGNLHLGFGLARGRAWRLDFGTHRPVDYAGTIVNVAARLQDLARPEGVVADVGFCDPIFRSPNPDGQQSQVVLKGIEDHVEIWASNDVDLKG